MASCPIYNVVVPYIGPVDNGFYPGRMVRIHGTIFPAANRFGINLQCGPNTVPRDDIALHISCRFPENTIVRNSLQNMNWGPEETFGHMPLARGQGFEIIVLCDPDHYKIAVNGQHFTEYIHRIPYQRVSHLTIDGDVTIAMISYEGSAAPGSGFMPGPPVAPGYVAPPIPHGSVPYPPMPNACPSGPYPPAPAPYSAPYAPGPYPPPAAGPYPPQPGYGYQQPYGQPYPAGSAFPPPPPGHNQTSHKSGGGILDKAQSAISSVLGPRTGAGVAGTALGAGLAGAALSGHLSPKKAYKHQKKSHKKALKYGLPIAGVGLGAYALHKGFHRRSSSSSSSSSEEE
ncbi:hypothetical protein R5R35_006278 [Gryllus longicercus]|uniref:Galectin n=1 Tax=Gryllus longicercus TaxID=2509291 RepID=A0AAN9WTV3_9ORTH